MTPTSPQLSRRAFLVDVGRGAFAIAVVGLAGCTLGGTPRRDPSTVPGEAAWQRLSLYGGFVSAYVLVRSGEAAIVDVGGPGPSADPPVGNEGDILAALEAVGLGWGNVGHVILTHWHDDHAALGVLVVGDALTTNDGRPTSYPIGTTEDMEEAQRSVAKLAALDFETLFVGHGEPIQSGAAALVREFLDVCPLDLDLEPPAEAVCRHPMDLQ